MAGQIHWHIVRDSKGKEIGALGFIGTKVAVVTSFYEDGDANRDGEVSTGEWLGAKLSFTSMEGSAVADVAMHARGDLYVVERDLEFQRMASKLYLNFAVGMVADGIYSIYFSQGVSNVAKPIAGRLTSNLVKQHVIRKGMEASVKAAYSRAVKPN